MVVAIGILHIDEIIQVAKGSRLGTAFTCDIIFDTDVIGCEFC